MTRRGSRRIVTMVVEELPTAVYAGELSGEMTMARALPPREIGVTSKKKVVSETIAVLLSRPTTTLASSGESIKSSVLALKNLRATEYCRRLSTKRLGKLIPRR